ncbi:MAG: trigger factor [bacterium]|nr:trigger factor [bacterium]MCM1373788.1 trigger factor [Muribaculum sp.]
MRKKMTLILTVLLAAMIMSGCGEQTDALKDTKVEKYVTLGEYKGLPVQLAAAAVTEEYEAEVMEMLYRDSVTAQRGGVMDREVVQGDTVNIDYVGKKDDVAFNGGTASGAELEIGSGSFIEGFEEGLIGALPGETRVLNLTFPDNFRNTELAGQAVVFTVTVNFIYPTEYSDDVVAGLGVPEISTVEEMRQFVHDYLESNAQTEYEYTLRNALANGLINGCEFKEIPAHILEKYRNTVQANLEAECAASGMDANSYCNYRYGMDAETFQTQYAEAAAKQGLAFQAVANAEKLNISDEELQEKLEQYASEGGFDSVEEFVGELDREEYREYFMYEKVFDFLSQNAQITEY